MMETQATTWKPAEGFFKFEKKGDELEGIYWGSKKASINGKDAVIHVLETKNRIVNVYGNAVLNDKIGFVPVGRLIKIVLTGLTNEDGKNYKNFTLHWAAGK